MLMFPILQFIAKPPCPCTKAPGTIVLASHSYALNVD